MKVLGIGILMTAVSLVTMAGCGADDETTSEAAKPEAFQAGNFQLYTKKVDDKCTDNALQVLFQPDAPAEYKLASTTEFPAHADLPKTITVKLQEPFSSMEAKVESGGDKSMTIADASQTGVEIGDGKDCKADMTIDVDITIADNSNIDLAATLQVKNWTGDECPELQDPKAESCTVTLTMRGERL